MQHAIYEGNGLLPPLRTTTVCDHCFHQQVAEGIAAVRTETVMYKYTADGTTKHLRTFQVNAQLNVAPTGLGFD